MNTDNNIQFLQTHSRVECFFQLLQFAGNDFANVFLQETLQFQLKIDRDVIHFIEYLECLNQVYSNVLCTQFTYSLKEQRKSMAHYACNLEVFVKGKFYLLTSLPFFIDFHVCKQPETLALSFDVSALDMCFCKNDILKYCCDIEE